jgi:hypothetical protein
MQCRFHRWLFVGLSTLACAAAVSVSLWRPGRDVRTEDQNHDGRPDVWREYDRQGHLARVAVDTNFDGRSDVQEYYQGGALVRRESDRDFNDRVDLVQDFDVQTRQSVRSIVDVDFDGTADLLILFQDGQPVFSKWAGRIARVGVGTVAPQAAVFPRTADDQLAPIEDPFRSDLSVRAVGNAGTSGDCVEFSAAGGLPTLGTDLPDPPASRSAARDPGVSHPLSAFVAPHPPRGPPPPSLPS